jgi:hypothetical protein
MGSRFARLSTAERSLLPRLVLLVALTRVALWLLPFSWVRGLFRQRALATAFRPNLVRLPTERLAWAVQTASRPIPAASCLTQSLALQFLLGRSGRASSLRIGVAKSPERGFQAHAWVECAGRILLDRPEEIAGYTLLASFEAV